MSTPASPVTVVYVAGISYSGSTLLGQMLGEGDGSFYGGELRNTWQRGIAENRVCTCGAEFRECGFWQAVVERLPFAADERAEELSRLHRRMTRMRERAALSVSRGGRAALRHDLDVYAEATEALYRAVAGAAGASRVVDSSKSPLHARLLARLGGVDLRVVHLVRDPRATTFSFMRRRDLGYGGALTRSLRWTSWNIATERLAALGAPYVRVRYEDLVEDPAACLARIGDTLAIDTSSIPLEGRSVRLTPTHIFSGNRARGEFGTRSLRDDSEWRSALPGRMQTVVRATTLPLRMRYGYRSR
jgi:hypothetical protein